MKRALLTATLLLSALPLFAQIRTPRPSPKASVLQAIGVTDVTILYSRPGVKGRPIWGTLVPWDKVWRTGANEATAITFSNDVTVEGQKLAAGTYALATIPTANEWTLIFNSDANQWGAFSYDEKKDVLRVKVKPQAADFREWMTFEVPEISADSAKIVLRWEKIAVPFTVATDTKSNTMAGIRTSLGAAKPDDWRIRYNAANYAWNNGNAADAQKWLDESLKINENVRNLWLKAQMQAKAGDKTAAKATAAAALAKATDADKDFVAQVKKDLEGWK